LLGVITGQLLGAVVEASRNRRETEQRTFEHWRDKKFEAYSDFFRFTEAWRQTIIGAVSAWNAWIGLKGSEFKDIDEKKETFNAIFSRYNTALSEESQLAGQLRGTLAVLRIVASDSAYQLFSHAYRTVIETGLRTTEYAFKDAISKDGIDAILDPIREAVRPLRKAARAELGIE